MRTKGDLYHYASTSLEGNELSRDAIELSPKSFVIVIGQWAILRHVQAYESSQPISYVLTSEGLGWIQDKQLVNTWTTR